MSSENLLAITQDPQGVVHLHADAGGLDSLISRLQKLRAHLEKGESEHDHFMTPAWAGTDLSEIDPIPVEVHSQVHHLKIFAWTDDQAVKQGLKN